MSCAPFVLRCSQMNLKFAIMSGGISADFGHNLMQHTRKINWKFFRGENGEAIRWRKKIANLAISCCSVSEEDRGRKLELFGFCFFSKPF